MGVSPYRSVGNVTCKANEIAQAKFHVSLLSVIEFRRDLLKYVCCPAGVPLGPPRLPLPNLHACGRQFDQPLEKVSGASGTIARVPQLLPSLVCFPVVTEIEEV